MFELRLSQGIKCRACGGFMHEHEAGCPQEKLAAFANAALLREHHCPKCHQGSVAINRDDFYECRECRTQFATGPACGEDAATLEKGIILDYHENCAINVVVMTSKGRGKFRDNAIIEVLKQEVEQTIAQREGVRKPRRRTPSIYQRLMKEIRAEQKK